MTFADGWTCRACWKSNRQQDPVCYRCKTPRDADEAQIEERKAAAEAAAATPEKVPDLLVALPVVIFRSYSRVWVRGGLGVLGILAFLVFGGVTDIGYLALTGGMGAGPIVIGSVMAFEILAPGLANPTAIRWGSVIVFGGAGVAAVAGLVLLFTRRDAEA
jgi:hypothetical protein